MTLKGYWGCENMREIKFRAWNCETKQFDPCFYFLTEGDGITNKIIGIEDDNWNEQLIKDGAVILQQYTGLKDKNGREIYEGDLLHHTHEDCICLVVWDKESACWSLAFPTEDGGFELERLCDQMGNVEVLMWDKLEGD